MEEDIFSVDADLTALKELEETLKENPDKEWLEYDGRKWIKEDYVVLKSKVKEKIEELNKIEKEMHENKNHSNDINEIYKYAVEEDKAKYGAIFLQELLREE